MYYKNSSAAQNKLGKAYKIDTYLLWPLNIPKNRKNDKIFFNMTEVYKIIINV